ncbi:glycosyltransferase family 4 protein [Paenibacillus sp. J45TS6]|uniref:glycosyltransferase family 4 protein n=1 Tax=Paenibacillus sp. J45TS6 TaxID=2807196 RepID=UPI001BCF00FC|nr:glycosyltransferase family 4 protein [Paenibacillus sp. J45TS6]
MEIVADDLACSLAEKGVYVTIITTSLKQNQNEIVTKKRENMRLISLANMPPMKYSSSWWNKSASFFRELNTIEPVDVVFSVSAAGYAVSKLTDKPPLVFQAHGTALGEIKTKIRLDWKSKVKSLKNFQGLIKDIVYLKKFDLIITVGQKVFNDLESQMYFKAIPKLNITNCVDDKLFLRNDTDRSVIRSKWGIAENSKVFISSSRLHAEKGILDSIKIFQHVHLSDENTVFFVIGDGPQEELLKTYCKETNLANSVLFVGKLDREELAMYYSAADYLLFSTLREEAGLPLTVLEAISSSLICFVSDKIKFEPGTPLVQIFSKQYEESARIIEEVVNSAQSTLLLSTGQKFISNNYSREKWISDYITVFDNLIDKEKVHAE